MKCRTWVIFLVLWPKLSVIKITTLTGTAVYPSCLPLGFNRLNRSPGGSLCCSSARQKRQNTNNIFYKYVNLPQHIYYEKFIVKVIKVCRYEFHGAVPESLVSYELAHSKQNFCLKLF